MEIKSLLKVLLIRSGIESLLYGILLVVARSLVTQNHESRARKIQRLLDSGWTPEQVAAKLGRGDKKREATIFRQIRRLAADEESIQLPTGSEAKGLLILALPAVAEAVARRAAKGNIPAAKLLFETTGFFSPKSKVEHSGEVAISLKQVPRPPVVQDEVVDATVVED